MYYLSKEDPGHVIKSWFCKLFFLKKFTGMSDSKEKQMGDKSNSIDFCSNVVENSIYLKVCKDLDIVL